jgi:phosphohistidine phosphatase
MRVVLFRHGIAVDRADPDCPPDPRRPLTPRGIARTRRAARGLARLGVAPGRIVSSPYVRAVETAEIAADALGFPGSIDRHDDLVPGADAHRFPNVVGPGDPGEILVAGHNPHLSSLLSLLVTGDEEPVLWLKKAGAACLELDETCVHGELLWMMPPRALRRLGSGK